MYFLLSVFLFFGTAQAPAAYKASHVTVQHAEVKSDSSKVALRKFDEKKLRIYSRQRAFMYDDGATLDLSLWNRFWQWFWKLTDKIFNNKISGSFIKYLVILIVVALLAFIVKKMIGADLKIFSKKSKIIEIPYSESEDNIHEINFSEEIEKAITRSNYRLAVRLLYLLTLKKLSDNSLIQWQPEKTNQTYINEISDPEQRQQFSVLTHQFEYIWYGEFFIGKSDFDRVKNIFEQFNPKAS